MPEHSAAFKAVRDELLASPDPDRAAIARLFGAMQAPHPDPTPQLVKLLRAIATLEEDDIVKLARWTKRYVNAWGQVPQAAGRGVDYSTSRETVKPDQT